MVLTYSKKTKNNLKNVGTGLLVSGSIILAVGVPGGIIASPLYSYGISGTIVYGSSVVGTVLTVSGIVTICIGKFSKEKLL